MKQDKSNNIYKQNPKEPCAFNSVKSFADNAREVTREQRESQQDRIAKLIAHTQLSLNEKC